MVKFTYTPTTLEMHHTKDDKGHPRNFEMNLPAPSIQVMFTPFTYSCQETRFNLHEKGVGFVGRENFVN